MKSSPEYFKRLFFCLALLALFTASPTLIDAQEAVEYQVKAAFIHKFIKFTKWPESTFMDGEDALIIGVLGESPVWSALKKLERKLVRGRRLKIIKVYEPCRERKCHILFISKTENSGVQGILHKLDRSNILTIGESNGFCQIGGMINLIIISGKIRFEVNIAAIEESSLRLSSKMLRLGKLIKTKPTP